MFKKSFAGLLAAVCTISTASVIPGGIGSAEDTSSYQMKVSVDVSGTQKEISPYIYGINEYANASNLKNVKVNNVRQGGNRFTGYNWETNYSNAGNDWLHTSDNYYGTPASGPAKAARDFSETCSKYEVPYKITTLQMAGYVSADMDGTVSEEETAPSDRWKEVKFRKDGELSLEPDTTDDAVYMDEYVNYLVKTLGDSTTSTGFQGYSLDNEPALWNDSHPRLHKDEVTNSELVSKSIELAKVVKEIDPNAEVFGPAFWGMLPCIQIGETGNGFTDPDWQSVKGNYNWYLDYYLDQMKKAEEESGQRLLDVVDVHYYAQANNFTDDAILQAARSLYDETYVEDSWLQPYLGKYFPFIPNIQESIDKYYPGTKIAISEYNLGNIGDENNTGKSVITAIAEAEALGCFADNGVYFATYWGTLPECPYVQSAINLYTNYDGKGGSFGDTLVEAKTEDVSKAYAYAAINSGDDSKLSLVLSNKDKTSTETANIDISGASTQYKSATVYAITDGDSDIRVIDVKNDLSGNSLTVELPPLSVAQIVFSDKESDEEVYVAPDIEKKEVVYNFSELEKSANGYLMIPIEDGEHLTKAVINSTASCTSGANWYGGGGGLCFNHLVSDETDSTWASKSFMYSAGTGDTTVTFDGTFNVPDPDDPNSTLEVTGTFTDTYMEFQDWWKSSTNDSTGADVSVTYNTITLYYEYDNTQPEEGTTTTTTAEPEVTTTTTTSTGEQKNIVYGDATNDGEIKLNDAVLIMQAISNPNKFGITGTDELHITEDGWLNADCNNPGDGVSGKDALAIQKFMLQLIESLPETEE